MKLQKIHQINENSSNSTQPKAPINDDYKKLLIDNGISEQQATHFAHLFTRDAIVLYEDKIETPLRDGTLFQNINSSNWQSLRFKPPEVDCKCFWRVEFRPMSVQPTSFQLTAFLLFTIVVTRAILK